MLLIATVIANGRESGSTVPELAAAEAAAKASLHPSGPGGPASFVSPEHGGSDEPAANQLFSTSADVSCDDLDKDGKLLRYDKDKAGNNHGPFPEAQMREWWRNGQFEPGPDLPVKLKTWKHSIKLKKLSIGALYRKRSASPTIDRAELIFLRRLGGNSRVEAHQYD